ncbi:sensor histidine kinase [Thalassobaculum salexigens]|uniref:sensor histidine kinase n=1 Tax=Thalassobaculum salexigens TaxID=455360 RepID=UPI00041A12B3|nr:stimulus-sensing domain-containing protein [Thalassobaculum salexigens]
MRADPSDQPQSTGHGRGASDAGRTRRATPRRRKVFALRWPSVSGLTARILAINLVSIAILFVGVLYLDRYQNALIRGELDALTRQAEVIARAIGELGIEPNVIQDEGLDPVRVQRIVRRLSVVTSSRIRVYHPTGAMLADSRRLAGPAGTVRIVPLPPPMENEPLARLAIDLYNAMVNWLPRRGQLPIWREQPSDGGVLKEVTAALAGTTERAVRKTEQGGLILSTAVPVQRYKQVLGALMLSLDGDEIDTAVREVRFEILSIFAFTLLVTILLSLYLAGTITRPIQRLAHAAVLVRNSRHRRIQIPDFGGRKDEIGDLSRSIRSMTEELWRRLDAIEGFAADVAHEIKNPLTSLRSAVETAARIDDPERQRRLLAVVVDDVERLNRLITDISSASRIAAEISREEEERVDVGGLLGALAEVYKAAQEDHGGPPVRAELTDPEKLFVNGHEGRLVQVLRNLIENAVSFSPSEGSVRLRAYRENGEVVIVVEDDGPGLPEGKLDAVFDRFYSERPEGEKFGTHSGLGLSISRQIIEAHEGTVRAENRKSPDGRTLGARFLIRLPAADD